MYRIRWLAMFAALVSSACAIGQEPGDNSEKPEKKDSAAEKVLTPAEQYRSLVEQYSQAQQEFSKAYRAAKTDEERTQVLSKGYPRPDQYAERFMQIAEKHPDDPAAIDALAWVAQSVSGYEPASKKARDKAIALLTERHIEHERLKTVVQALAYSQAPSSEKLLRAAMEKSPHRDVQGYAHFTLAQYLGNRLESAKYYKNLPAAQFAQLKKSLGEETFNAYQNLDEEKIAQEIERLCETVVEKYGDLKSYRGTLKDAAENKLFEIRFLAIGKTSPEIEGESIDGSPMKLSDYRGKIVVLDFWGDW